MLHFSVGFFKKSLTIGAVARDTFTVVNDHFTTENCGAACDGTAPGYICHGKYPWLRQKEESNRL